MLSSRQYQTGPLRWAKHYGTWTQQCSVLRTNRQEISSSIFRSERAGPFSEISKCNDEEGILPLVSRELPSSTAGPGVGRSALPSRKQSSCMKKGTQWQGLLKRVTNSPWYGKCFISDKWPSFRVHQASEVRQWEKTLVVAGVIFSKRK